MTIDPIQELVSRLARYPELRVTTTPTSVTVAAPSPEGFEVGFQALSNEYIVRFDGWHEHFETAEQALQCFAFAFSGEARLAVTYRGRMAVKWVLEHLEEGEWRFESEVGLLLVPFWCKRRIVYRQNPKLQRSPSTSA